MYSIQLTDRDAAGSLRTSRRVRRRFAPAVRRTFMSKAHRLIALFGGAVAALAFGGLASMALGHAESAEIGDGGPYATCEGAICLVMGDPITAEYDGVRPYVTD